MKKLLFVIGLATLAMASCSKEETISVKENDAIGFRAGMGTRATLTTTDVLTSFKVTALANGAYSDVYFPNLTFANNNGTSTSYISDPVYRWPSQALDFFAWYGGTTELPYNATNPTGNHVTINDQDQQIVFQPVASPQQQIDLVTAVLKNQKEPTSSTTAQLRFHHRLSQIQVHAKNGNSTYQVEVKGLRIARINNKATFDLNYDVNPTTTPDDTQKGIVADSYEAVSYDPTNINYVEHKIELGTAVTLGQNAASIMGAHNQALLIPQKLEAWTLGDADATPVVPAKTDGAYLAMLVKITSKDADGNLTSVTFPKTDAEKYNNTDFGWVAVGIDTDWLPGRNYLYTVDFSNGAGWTDPEKPDPQPVMGGNITFTVAIDGWQDANPQPGVTM